MGLVDSADDYSYVYIGIIAPTIGRIFQLDLWENRFLRRSPPTNMRTLKILGGRSKDQTGQAGLNILVLV